MNFLAKTIDGLEQILQQEIIEIGGDNVQTLTRAVSFEGDLGLMYKVSMMSRTALKILVPITEVDIADEQHLYDEVHSLPWYKFFGLNNTFSVDATVSSEVFTHSKYISLKTKDAIVDKFRRKYKERPNVNPINPQFTINVHIRGNTMTLSMDCTGESLHRRGYRVQPIEAPLNEVLAAGLVLLSGWNGNATLWDPMCGSGTIAIEAARIALNIPPQSRHRTYQFQNWPNYDKELFYKVQEEVYGKPLNNTMLDIRATDKSIQSINSAEINIKEAGLENYIRTERLDFFRSPDVTNTTIIANPPYDQRLKVDDIEKFYKMIGDHLKQHCHDSEAWIFSGNIDAIKSVGLKPNQKYNMHNGPIESKFYKYETYSGSLINEDE